jgi:hypothetical protein
MSEDFSEQIRINLEHLGLANKPKLYKEFTGFEVEHVVALERSLTGDDKTVARATQHIVCEDSPQIPLKVRGAGFTLYPPQAALIAMMLKIEGEHSYFSARKLAEANPGRYANEYQTNVGFVLERLSFGKSTLIPAMICYQPKAKWRRRNVPNSCCSGPFVVTDDHPVLKGVNIIVASRLVVPDWEARLRRTELKHVIIKSDTGLQKALSMLKEFSGQPLVIVVRSGSFKVGQISDLAINHFSRATHQYAFSRVFYDDFDMLDLAPTPGQKSKRGTCSLIPKACFHWLLSGSADLGKWFPDHPGGVILPLNPIGFESFGSSGGDYQKVFFSTRCNTNFSEIEFQVPPIRWFSSLDLKVTVANLCTDIALSGVTEFSRKTSAFVTSTRSVPYDRATHGTKILVSVEDKAEQQSLVAELQRQGIGAVLLDRRNAHLFGTLDKTVGVSRLIHGLSMGFLTHVVILERNYTPEQIDQVVGRAQRLGRKHDLQVFMIPTPYDSGYTAGLNASLLLRERAADFVDNLEYCNGYLDAMKERSLNFPLDEFLKLDGELDHNFELGFLDLQACDKGFVDGSNCVSRCDLNSPPEHFFLKPCAQLSARFSALSEQARDSILDSYNEAYDDGIREKS